MLWMFRQTRIEREKRIVAAMISLYCRGNHGTHESLCPDCKQLREYALTRLDRCKFGNNKSTCAKCPVHCYKKDMRETIRCVMRYAGPRMTYRHPLMAVWHLREKLRG